METLEQLKKYYETSQAELYKVSEEKARKEEELIRLTEINDINTALINELIEKKESLKAAAQEKAEQHNTIHEQEIETFQYEQLKNQDSSDKLPIQMDKSVSREKEKVQSDIKKIWIT